MSIPFKRKLVLLTFLCNIMHPAAAGDASFVTMFGSDPGLPLAHGYSYGLPAEAGTTYTLRIPAVDRKVREIFYDTVLTISNPEKIVQQVAASRAFDSLEACDEARNVVLEKLAVGLSKSYTGQDQKWQLQSDSGHVVARAVCEKLRHYPRPVLHMLITIRP